MTEEQMKENMKRMEELCNNKDVMEKLAWAAKKLGDKNKVNKCLCCNNKANGMGMFLLHRSMNSIFNLEEGKERLYLYFACDDHVMDNGLKEVEDCLKCGSKNCSYVDIN